MKLYIADNGDWNPRYGHSALVFSLSLVFPERRRQEMSDVAGIPFTGGYVRESG